MTDLSTGRRPHTRPAISWHGTVASVRGSAHAADVGNQDAAGLRELSARTPTWVAVVSDGHGGERYVRSDVGARFAVDAALSQLQAALAETGLDAEVLAQQFGRIVARWRAAVLQDCARRPFTTQERRRAGRLSLDDDPILAYGATLLIAVMSGGEVAVAQLGDGDVLVRGRDRQPLHPIPFDERLVAGQTTSLCLPTATADVRFAHFGEADDVDLVVIATDGYANSFAEERWWPTVVEDMGAFIDRSGPAALDGELGTWLAESAQVGGDDVTVAVLCRMPRDTRHRDLGEATAREAQQAGARTTGDDPSRLLGARAVADAPLGVGPSVVAATSTPTSSSIPPSLRPSDSGPSNSRPSDSGPSNSTPGPAWTDPTLNETVLLTQGEDTGRLPRSHSPLVPPGRPPATTRSAQFAASPTVRWAQPTDTDADSDSDHDYDRVYQTAVESDRGSGDSGSGRGSGESGEGIGRWWLYLALLVVVIAALVIGVLLIRDSGSTRAPTGPVSPLAPATSAVGDHPTAPGRTASNQRPAPVAPAVSGIPAHKSATNSGSEAAGIAPAATASTVPSSASTSGSTSAGVAGATSVGPQGGG